ncbi:MAG TPA: hypothetical protein VN923_16715 [Thermoanaerobaculia bacterium]|nr:hypothetical protein [Thermoanaerobaculia bacterium]
MSFAEQPLEREEEAVRIVGDLGEAKKRRGEVVLELALGCTAFRRTVDARSFEVLDARYQRSDLAAADHAVAAASQLVGPGCPAGGRAGESCRRVGATVANSAARRQEPPLVGRLRPCAGTKRLRGREPREAGARQRQTCPVIWCAATDGEGHRGQANGRALESQERSRPPLLVIVKATPPRSRTTP